MKLEDISICDVLRDYVGIEINGSGDRVGVKCPFHDGKTGSSLSVYVDSNNAYCFGGCGFIDKEWIVAKVQGISRQEALRELIRRYNVSALTAQEEQEIRKYDLLQKYITTGNQMMQAEHYDALKARAINTGEIPFGLHSESIGMTEEELSYIGITPQFKGQIILPCYLNKKLVYVIAWNWNNTPDCPKYVKPSGWNVPIIGEYGEDTIIVEGYFDMLSAQQAGFSAISPISDTVTKTQRDWLKKRDSFIVCFDNDSSGRTAQEELARELFPAVKAADVSALGDCKDLNELLCSVGPEKFRETVEAIIEKAEDVMERALREFERLKETDERKAGKFVMESLIPLAVKLQPGEKEPVLKMLSERTKSIGIGIREIKKAVGAQEPKDSEEEEEDVDIMETIPDIIDQPLAMIRDRVYAITRLWVNRKREGTNEQEEMEFIITDRGEAIPKHKAHSTLNVKVTLKELPLPNLLLSGKAVNAFMKGYRPEVSYVFDRIAKVFDRYIDFSLSFGTQEQMCKLSACLSLLTWFRLATEALPYPWPNGEKGSGKTQWGLVWSLCSFIGKAITSESSFAVFRDYAGYGASIMIDDAERVTDGKDKNLDAVRTLFLSGYRKGTSVDLKVKVGDDWISKVVDAYCPKAFTSIRVPEGAMGSRVIRIPLVRSINTEKTNYDPTNLRLWPCDWETLKDDSWLCALTHLPEASQINDELNNETELSGRDYERWKGVFLIAKLLDRHGKSNIEAEMREIMWQYFKDDAGETSDDERIPLIIEEIEQRLKDSPDNNRQITIPVKLISAAVTERAREAGIISNDIAYSSKTIGKILSRMRIGKTIHKRTGSEITINSNNLIHARKVFMENKNKFSAHIENDNLLSLSSQPDNHNDNESSALSSQLVTTCHSDISCHSDQITAVPPGELSDFDREDNQAIPEEFDLLHECPF